MAEKVLGWLEPDGPFDQLLKRTPAPEQQELRVGVLLRQWRSSDRFLFPALEIASRLGLEEAVGAVRSARQKGPSACSSRWASRRTSRSR